MAETAGLEKQEQHISQRLLFRVGIWLASLAFSAVVGISACTRVPQFWDAPRTTRALAVILAALVLLLPLRLLLLAAWQRMGIFQEARSRYWLAAALLAAVGLGYWTAPRLLLHHTVTIEAPGTGGLVHVLEIRDPAGQAVDPGSFKLSGDWQVTNGELTTGGENLAKLSIDIYAPNGKNILALFKTSPASGPVVVKTGGSIRKLDLKNGVNGYLPLNLSLYDLNPTILLVVMANILSAAGLIFCLFVIAAQYARQWNLGSRAAIQVGSPRYHAAFLAVLLILLLLPLVNSAASIQSFDKNFWGRKDLLAGWGNFRFLVLGDRVFQSIITAKGDWLVYTGGTSLDDYQGTLRVSNKDLKTIQDYLDTWNERLTAKGITFLFVVPPNKNTIYPEYMPAQVPVLNQQSLLDRLIAYEKTHGKTRLLDLRPALQEARQERQVYYATDTHWNLYGGLVGYQEIMRALQKDYPNLSPHPLDDYRFHYVGPYKGDISGQLGQMTVTEGYFTLEPRFQRQVVNWTTTAEDGRPMYITALPDQTLPRLVMYRDSFGMQLKPYLSDHFSRVVYVWSARLDERFIDSEQPDIVILEVTERGLIKLLNLDDTSWE